VSDAGSVEGQSSKRYEYRYADLPTFSDNF
jgi:hypothetical protein